MYQVHRYIFGLKWSKGERKLPERDYVRGRDKLVYFQPMDSKVISSQMSLK